MLEEQASILCRAIIQIHEGKYFMLVMELHQHTDVIVLYVVKRSSSGKV